MVRLGDVCAEIRERIPSTGITPENYVTTDNMLKACGGIRPADSVPQGTSLVGYATGDVLVSNIRPYLRKVWLADRDGGCSSDVIVFRGDWNVLAPEYLFRVLSQDGFSDYVMQNVSGTKMPRGKRDWIKGFRFPLPPLSVQQAIVARLEKELSETNRLVASFKRIAERAEDEFKAELEESFESIEGERVCLGDVCEIDGVLVKDVGKYSSLPHIGIDCIEKNTGRLGGYRTVGEDGVKSGKYHFSNRHIIYSKIRPNLNKVAVPEFEGLCSADSYPILPNEKCNRYWLAYLMRSSNFLHYVVPISNNRTGMPKVNRNELLAFEFQLPAVEIQEQIVTKLDAAKTRCEKLTAAAERGLRGAEKLRAAVLAEAFEG